MHEQDSRCRGTRREEPAGRRKCTRREEGGACGLATKREEPAGRRPAQPEGRRAGSRSRRRRRRGVALAPWTADARRSRRRRELQVRSFPFLLSFSLSPNGQTGSRFLYLAIDFPPLNRFPARLLCFLPAPIYFPRALVYGGRHIVTGHLPDAY